MFLARAGARVGISYRSHHEEAEEALERIRNFSFKPREIRDYLDRFVIQQQEAKKVLSVAICDHYNHVRQCLENPKLLEKDYHKQNILLLGPTGVGKTYLSTLLCGHNWFHYSGDYRIGTRYLDEPILDLIKQQAMQIPFLRDLLRRDWIYIRNNIRVDDLGPVLSFVGKLGNPELGGLGLEPVAEQRLGTTFDAVVILYGDVPLIEASAIRALAGHVGLDAPTQSALAAGLVMGIMIIPFVSSLSDDVINAVPQALRDGAYALGATKSETVRHVVLPAALPGVMGAFLLAISRAVGETMIVVMAAGRAANMPVNPLESVTTITVQIVSLLTGDQEFDSAKTLSAFALGLVLFMMTLAMNVVALHVVQKYREKYE